MLNAVMLVKNRPLLTKQAIDSFLANSTLEWALTVVDDCSSFQTERLLAVYAKMGRINLVRLEPEVCVTGRLRNLGVYWSEKMFGRGDLLYLSDNDAYFTPDWDNKLVGAIVAFGSKFKLIGPYRHPYHLPNEVFPFTEDMTVVATDAVQGLGHLMSWTTWDAFGPLDAHAIGTNQSEDFKFCQQIVKDGFLVGSIQPNVVYNCGLTGTNGKPSPGAEMIERKPGVIML